ncbi:class I SAM-dependent methyltransferase [Oscillibacter sp.]|uniref:class I SAM-dependent methyltransferase n=1 Tax=Oscillibacter sp. TaxID=1945593 RepID=UPI0028A96394|nr:class I SAM-dependent methyltransferase [Oscillibacter sp.]
MKEIESNKKAWSKISEDHYNTFKSAFEKGMPKLNYYIQNELGNISNKEIIHLQCNTGADTIILSKMGAGNVTGVDLVPDNIFYARKLADDLQISNVNFIESDIMELSHVHNRKYDIVFTSEGVLGWLPDLNVWAKTIRNLLKDNGFLYVFDSHPFFLSMDESKLSKEEYKIKYPYFGKKPDIDDSIGGYASEVKRGVKAYFWMHTLSDIVNALTSAGLHIEYLNEFTEYFCDSGDMEHIEDKGLYCYEYNTNKYPMSFSLKATVLNR